MNNEIIELEQWEIDESRKYMKQLCQSGQELREPILCKNILQKQFEESIDLRNTMRGNFYSCIFLKTDFNNFDCTDYFIYNCNLDSININNSNFNFLGIVESSISKSFISNSSFEFSSIESTDFINTKISSCNFQSSLFKNSYFYNCDISCTDFKGSIIENCVFDNINFFQTDLQYVEFNHEVQIIKSQLLIEDILHCFNGLECIQRNKNNVKLKLFEDSTALEGNVFLSSLNKMLGYFYSIYDYFSIANIYIFGGDKQKAYNAILLGIKHNLKQRDFKLIRYLSKLAATSSLFTKKDLKNIYNYLNSYSMQQGLTRFEYRHFINELFEIKHLLIESPYNLTQMSIIIETTIDEYDYNKLSNIINTIDLVADKMIPQTLKSISIRHNSSPIIEILLSDYISYLIPFFALICAIFGASSKYIDKIYDIAIKREELKSAKLSNNKTGAEIVGQLLSNRLREQEIEKAKLENEMLTSNLEQAKQLYEEQIKSTCVDPTDVNRISYNVLSDHVLMNEERRHIQVDLENDQNNLF